MRRLLHDRVLPRVRSAAASAQLWLPAGHLLPLLLVGAAALWARLHQLGEESVWIDEAISFVRANRSYDALIADSIHRKHLPTYFLILKAVLPYGDSEWMLRLPSALFSTAAALLAYALGAVLHGRLAGVACGLLFAFARVHVHYAQEARMYALMTMATLGAMLGLAWLASHPAAAAASPRALLAALRAAPGSAIDAAQARRAAFSWSAVLLFTVLAMYTHNTAPVFALALNVAALVVCLGMPGLRAGFARNWLLCMVGVVAIWSFWLPTLLRQTATMPTAWKGRAATLGWVSGVLSDLYLLDGPGSALGYLVLALAAFAVYGLRARKRLLLMLLVLALLGPLLFYAISQYVPMFYRRIVLWAGPPWLALVAIGLCSLPRPAMLVAACALALLMREPLAHYYASQTKPAWRPLLQKLASETSADSVILTARAERFLTYYFERKSEPLPERRFKRVRNRPRAKHLERQVGDAMVFYLVGQTQENAFRHARQLIADMGQYREVWFERHKNAALAKYRRKRDPESGDR
jgi:hypothetical protein